ncbi:plasmid stability protein stbC [Pseudomonas xanthomarina]|nr:plasmid stability protein stbC [Stutzerimonas xanthomarina]MCP9340128.1 plasmid stability protein stbC [Stutzerimonas xanthomarina]
MRDILESAVKPKGRVKLGSLLAEVGRKAKLTDEEFAFFESMRDRTPARAASFE